uniref:Uncharacterized protein n=1 Tax=Aegilops tauschii subsp. strangulata TaxID=200361 RepID=A0A453E345_AEGTS
ISGVAIAPMERMVSFAAHYESRGEDGNKDSCRGRRVYIHELPPRFNADMLGGCASTDGRWPNMCEQVSNAGLGQPLRLVRHAAVRAGRHLPRPHATLRLPHQRLLRGGGGVRPVLRRFRLRAAPLGLRQCHAGRRLARPGALARGPAGVAQGRRPRPLPRGGAHGMGLPAPHLPQPDLGHQPPLPGGRQEHDRACRRVVDRARPRQRRGGALPDLLPPTSRRRRPALAAEDQERRPPVAHVLRGRAAAGRPALHPVADHRPVRRLVRVPAAGLRLWRQPVPHPGGHHAAVPELHLLPPAAGGLVHAAVGVRRHGRRLRARLLPPGVRVSPVPVAPAGRSRHVLGVHTGGRRARREREHRGHAEKDTGSGGAEDAGGGHQARAEAGVR